MSKRGNEITYDAGDRIKCSFEAREGFRRAAWNNTDVSIYAILKK